MEDSKFKNKMMKVIREDAFYVKKVAKKREYMKLLEKKRLKLKLSEDDLKSSLERKRLTENAIERKQVGMKKVSV
uniref:Uncharacterized protein n=1 Tax=Eubacterium plexicaudatum ASF492 TaxID=1235802 RepID=N2A7G7_9FIRM